MRSNTESQQTSAKHSSKATCFGGAARWFAMAVLLLLSTAAMHAQFDSASVLGYVRDASGAAVPNATVTLTNTASNVAKTATTDNEGRYEFASVPIGNYRVD